VVSEESKTSNFSSPFVNTKKRLSLSPSSSSPFKRTRPEFLSSNDSWVIQSGSDSESNESRNDNDEEIIVSDEEDEIIESDQE
jgi:hypothetical protein